MRDNGSAEAQVRKVFAALDAFDVPALAALVSDDVRTRLGNSEAVDGKEAFVQTAEGFVASIAAIRHEIHSLWAVDDAVIAEMDVHYRRLDGKELTLPCCNTFRVRDNLIADYRVYMDISPVYA
jgi:ketosteroid isomerase-like protein